ncbi:MAG: glycosyltransferase family 2 protein [Planctomycetes bacterium]|nr:glycosyltransferase family 2 protein [Planctomycetota bacterium]
MHKLALIIPTRHRLELLSKLMATFEAQTVPPHQIIVVDGSDEPIEQALRERHPSVPITYVHVQPPGLTRQRNAGIAAVSDEATLVGYLDDDIELEPETVENLLRFWDQAGDDVGGVSFNITNNEHLPVSWFGRLFGTDSRRRGAILPSGFVTPVRADEEATPTEWLCGGATVWRREMVDRYKYDEWFAGTAYFEDVDFSYRVGQTHKLFVLRDARVTHNPPPYEARKMRYFGEMHCTYRYHFVEKHFGRKWPFYWSTLGVMATRGWAALRRWDAKSYYNALGTLVGLVKVLTGRHGAVMQDFRKTQK